jgi:tetratricopeptide (TPR) repeat protein
LVCDPLCEVHERNPVRFVARIFVDALRKSRVKAAFASKLILVGSLAWMQFAIAQAQQQNQPVPSSQSDSPSSGQQQNPSRTQQQQNQNPFPEDTSSVPVMPSKGPAELPPGVDEEDKNRVYLPEADFDPVRSPEDAAAAAEENETSSSSSLAGMRDMMPDADDDTTQPGTRNRKGTQIQPEHHETAAEDENVGKYYLDNKDWKAALSRFESALVLDPDNPDVYWGLAESDRHLGKMAEARTNYQKVVDYDPDSRHGKDAKKALKDPEIANASASQTTAGSH